MFHLDEYIGLPADHPASFRNYLRARLIDKVGITHHHLLDGEEDPAAVIHTGDKCSVDSVPIDVALVGIGENGHLAFNRICWSYFHIDQPYLVVMLDEACPRQQLGEGWFEQSLRRSPTGHLDGDSPDSAWLHQIIVVGARCAKGEGGGGVL